jgi:hypothetical protein
MVKRLFLISCLLLMTAVVFATDRFVFITNEYNKNQIIAYYFDTDTIKYTYSNDIGLLCVDVWVKMKFIKKDIDAYIQHFKEKDYSEQAKKSMIALYVKEYYGLQRYLMVNNKRCLVGYATYDKQGQVIHLSNFIIQKKWVPISPDSAGGHWYRVIMAYAKKNDKLLKSRM